MYNNKLSEEFKKAVGLLIYYNIDYELCQSQFDVWVKGKEYSSFEIDDNVGHVMYYIDDSLIDKHFFSMNEIISLIKDKTNK